MTCMILTFPAHHNKKVFVSGNPTPGLFLFLIFADPIVSFAFSPKSINKTKKYLQRNTFHLKPLILASDKDENAS